MNIIGDDLQDLISDFILTLYDHEVINLDGVNSGDGDALECNIYNLLKRFEQ